MDQIERPQYYDGEYLGADDLSAIVRYGRDGAARHALGAHVWGIATGLDLAERATSSGGVEMVLTPGLAWDGYGRGLVALAPQRIPLELFADFTDDTPPEGVRVEVWISYRELAAGPPGVGFACPDDDLHGRVVETFRVELRRAPTTDAHTVTVGGRAIAARAAHSTFDASAPPLYDESVAEQRFADDGASPPRWPLFVGYVRWMQTGGPPGSLVARTDDDHNASRAGRRYIGTVAETIAAPGGVLRLRDRARNPGDANVNFRPPVVAPTNTTVVNDLVWCEGNLRVVGDTRLQGGKLDYLLKKGSDAGVPMYLRRTFVSAPVAKTTLDAFIGPPAPPPGPVGAQTRFTVSTADASGNPRECLTVVTDGRVGINAADPTNTLQVTGPTGIRYGLAYVTGDAAWIALGYNAFTGPGGPWTFPDVTRRPAALVIDGASGAPDLRYQTNPTSNPAAWDVPFVVKGATGNAGFGIAAPTAKLHVHSTNPLQGDVQFFSGTSDVEWDGGTDKVFLLRHTGGAGSVTSFLGARLGVGTLAPNSPLAVRASGTGEELVSFEAPDGTTRWHVNQNLGGTQPGLNFAQTGVQDGRLFLAANGNVGIGTTTPTEALHVVRAYPPGGRILLGDATKFIHLRTDGSAVDVESTTHDLYVHAGVHNVLLNPFANEGRVGVGTQTPLDTLHVVGDIRVIGAASKSGGGMWASVSDARLKKDVEPIADALGTVLRLRGVRFTWREPEKIGARVARPMGMIAQEVEQVLPEWVSDDHDGMKMINPIGLEALTIEAIRALADRCTKLEAELAELKARVGVERPRRRRKAQ